MSATKMITFAIGGLALVAVAGSRAQARTSWPAGWGGAQVSEPRAGVHEEAAARGRTVWPAGWGGGEAAGAASTVEGEGGQGQAWAAGWGGEKRRAPAQQKLVASRGR